MSNINIQQSLKIGENIYKLNEKSIQPVLACDKKIEEDQLNIVFLQLNNIIDWICKSML